MEVFGPQWSRHWEKIEAKWRERVTPEDVVLLPGDHSWGMRLEDARRDLEWLEALPGHKVLSRGNHDYWWQGIGKIRKAFPGMTFLQNDAATFGSVGVCATRGWLLPGSEGFSQAQDEKIYRREVERLGLALKALPAQVRTRVVMIHYPPLLPHLKATEFTACLEEAGVDLCVYGHIHRTHRANPFQGLHRGVRYQLLSCDFVDFTPQPLDLESEEDQETA
jgi:predicted phosphohydrolase